MSRAIPWGLLATLALTACQSDPLEGVDVEAVRQVVAQVDDDRVWADISAAREAVGYAPSVPFEEGVRRFVAWLRGREG